MNETLETAAPQRAPEQKPPFERVYEQHYFEVFRFISRHLDNHHEAEDLTGDIFLYCYKNYERYDPQKSAITTWLFLVAKSKLKTYYRDKKSHLDLSDFEDWLLSEEPDMSRALYLEQLRGFLAEKIRLLPEKQQQVVVLRYFRDKPFEEIARRLDTSPGNVRVMLTRAIARLKQYMNETEIDWRD